MAYKFIVNKLIAYLIRQKRCFAFFFTSFICAANVLAADPERQLVKDLPSCSTHSGTTSEIAFLNHFEDRQPQFDAFKALQVTFQDPEVCNSVDKFKAKTTVLCEAAELYRSPFTTREQVRKLLQVRKYGNITALRANLIVAEKFAPLLEKQRFLDYFVNPPKGITEKILRSHPGYLMTNGASNPPKRIPPGIRFEPDKDMPISVSCDDKNNCCKKNIRLYDIASNISTGKEIFVQRANLLAVGAIVPKPGKSRGTCSLVLLSNSLAMTASHCITSQEGFNAGLIETAGPSFEKELDFVAWTPKGDNPSMASATNELTACYGTGLPPGNCDITKLINFTKLENVTLIFPLIKPNENQHTPDIALLSFNAIENIPKWGFAELNATPPISADTNLTTLGFGRTSLGETASTYGPQVGWLPYDEVEINVVHPLLTIPKTGPSTTGVNEGAAMACKGDSGGGLFSGFHAGRYETRLNLLGITSQVQGQKAGDGSCAMSRSIWVSPHGFKKDICMSFPYSLKVPDGLTAFCKEFF